MLTGYMPFEEENIPKLYQKIKENKYSIPLTISKDVRDLIFRMLQADPLFRISIPEIKIHRWFTTEINMFIILDNRRYCYSNLIEVSQDIIDRIIGLGIEVELLDIEGIKKCIKAREKKSLTVMYEIMESKKIKTDIEERHKIWKNEEHFLRNWCRSDSANEKLKKIRKHYCNKKIVEMNDWRLGFVCQKDCYMILTEILKSLQMNKFDWKMLSSSYKIKARKNTSEDQKPNKLILYILIQIFSVNLVFNS
jgi:serine/threonine protein kinase